MLIMTETLLQKLEEKMMIVVSQLEDARKEIELLRHDNLNMKLEKDRQSKKLNDLLSLLDTVDGLDRATANLNTVKPILFSADTIG